ncbi:MAG: hypothetical protein IPM51_05080 [Sphingobacteriaceae bacterium]|nr:hypothetical protein [Sphingobacteriaceae bacterium]
MSDTVFIPKENKTYQSDYLEVELKNKSLVQLVKADNKKYYLRMIVTENLYFDKVALLEVISGKKSFYVKDTKHHQFDKHRGYYCFEIFQNYIGTLKDDGITAIEFGKVHTSFSKSDCNHIKSIAKCFYESISEKK